MRIFSYFDIDTVDCIFHESQLLFGNLPSGGQLNSIQTELGMMQLNDLDRKNKMRMGKGLELYERLKTVDSMQVPLLEKKPKIFILGVQFWLKTKRSEKMLLKKEIDVSLGYMQDCSRLDVFKEFKKNCPNASRVEDEMLYLPVYDELTHSELRYIAEAIKQTLEQLCG